MKLTDLLADVGRPVAYFPKMKKLTGSTTATILLCQFIYWRGKEADPDGWLYKTSDEIEEETGLSYNEQKTARKALVAAELLQEHYARLDHQLKFKIDLDKINEKWGILQPEIPQSDDSAFASNEMSQSLNVTENTTENTTERKPFTDPLWDLQHGKTPILTEKNKKKFDEMQAIEELVTKLETGLRLNFPRGTKDQAVYRRLLNSEKPVERFIEWVKADERRFSFAFLYAKDTSTIWRDFPQAFPAVETNGERPSSFYG